MDSVKVSLDARVMDTKASLVVGRPRGKIAEQCPDKHSRRRGIVESRQSRVRNLAAIGGGADMAGVVRRCREFCERRPDSQSG